MIRGRYVSFIVGMCQEREFRFAIGLRCNILLIKKYKGNLTDLQYIEVMQK